MRKTLENSPNFPEIDRLNLKSLRDSGGNVDKPTKNTGQFEKGRSGHPAERVEDIDSPLADRIKSRSSNGQRLIEILFAIANDPKEKTTHRIAAVEQLFLRGWGKPTMPVDISGEIDVTERILVGVSDEELDKLLEE